MTVTREAWIIPLLEALGHRLTFQRRAAEADGRSYPISHQATASEGAGLVPAQGDHTTQGDHKGPLPADDASGPPVHIVAFDQKLAEEHARLADLVGSTARLMQIEPQAPPDLRGVVVLLPVIPGQAR